ncbi:HigA family addiction module antitoxin [Novosphingobium sp.]|uniref:HigA family addiction module antitoxin n=1 Tax=Novosphingobium sp. TaxID=1874826 RepID=UPI00343C3307
MPIPALPDGLIKHEIIALLELTVTAATQALGVTRAALSTLLNERANLSPEMALRVEKAIGGSMDTMMRM